MHVYLSIHVEQQQMEIVHTIPTKMAIGAEVCYISTKGFSDIFNVRNYCTCRGTSHMYFYMF